MFAANLILLLVFVCFVHCKECSKDKEKCFFHFEIEFKLTMMNGRDKVFAENGKLYRYDVMNTSDADPIPTKNVISADGWEEPKLVTLVNGKFPGPTIIVYEGQKVIVEVKNKLEVQSVTIHWHGLHQKGTPWMDGVPYVNQCPIGPGQTFKYTFTPTQTGTYWWHSHTGSQRTDGVYGAFIIRKKSQADDNERIMMIQDWNHSDESDKAFEKYSSGYFDGRFRVPGFYSLDGISYGPVRVHSGLINGKGRYFDRDGSVILAPLTIFKATKGSKIRFRVINAGTYYPFRISVDEHQITVVASDGYDLEPVPAESVIIWPGERYDFEILADQSVGNYWIRGIMLVQPNPVVAMAILRYDGTANTDPITSRRNCTENNPCIALNCPFPYFPEENTLCKTFGEFKALNKNYPAPKFNEKKSKNYFLNFAFPGTNWKPGSVNGHTFYSPDVNPLIQPREWQSTCDKKECGKEKVCQCTYALEFGGQETIQMVLTNLGKGGNNAGHVIHMHGHSFHVIKQGFGQYDEETSERLSTTNDIDCRSQSFCNQPRWSDERWNTGDIPGAKLNRAPQKDSILLPGGGYVVIRFKADNPGLWLMHCHQDRHDTRGMRLLLNETFSGYPKAPRTLPTCHSYPVTQARKDMLRK